MDIVLLQTGTVPAVEVGFSAGADATGDVGAAPGPASFPNLASAFVAAGLRRAGHPVLVSKDGVVSYASLLQAANRVCRYLVGRPDYRPGALVTLQLSNSLEYLAAFYGTLLADCVVVPLPVALEASRRQAIHQQCQPSVLISRAADFDPAGHDGEPVSVNLFDDAAVDASVVSQPHRAAGDLAMLLYTSGSTGAPKGVMLTHRNLLANAGSILQVLPVNPDDRTLVVLPFCHALGNSILQTHILSGATLLVKGALTFPSSIVEALRELGATSFSAVPEVYGMLLKYGRLGERPLPDLRYMAVAGGAMKPDLAADVARRIAPASFYIMYGQSEATSRLSILAPDDLGRRIGSIGTAIPGVKLAIMDDENRELPVGAVGMLCARGDNVMAGYWDDPAATADVLDADGWLRTGDLARRDADGYFYIQGRANLLIKVQGQRVHPAEIESVVEAGFPQVRAVAIPVSRNDEARFMLFLASQDNRPVDVPAIRAACQKELPSFKQPVNFEVLDRLPLTPSYKVDRAALSRLVGPKPDAAATLRPTG